VNTPFTPPETVPTRRSYTDAWGRPVRGSFFTVDDQGRTGLVLDEDAHRFLRGFGWGLAITGVALLVVAPIAAGLRAGGVL
jgi:hypothetical protein